MSRSTVIAPAALSLLAVAGAAWSAPISATIGQRASAKVNCTTSGCSNNPGPYITINGEIDLGGVKARIILSNNAKLTHVASTDVVADVDLIPDGDVIQIAKQPSRGGVGGNPWIYLQFNDCKGHDYSGPILLGRCVQGLSPAALNFALPTLVRAGLVSGECSNSPGPYVTLDGDLTLGGLGSKIILTNNAKFTHATSADVVIDVELLPDGKNVTFHKQPPLGGAGGNPWIYLQFCDGKGSAYGSPILVGRCNKLGG
jgi:hypothetical protein